MPRRDLIEVPSADQPEDPGRGDWLLEHLASILDEIETEGGDIWVSIVLLVGGTMITGLAGNAQSWLALQVDALRQSASGDDQGLAFLGRWAAGLDETRAELKESGPAFPVDYLHLRNVSVAHAGGVSNLTFLRVRLDQVEAWHLGRPT
jgi:hypothetical protein